MLEDRSERAQSDGSRAYQIITLVGLIALAVLVLAFNLDIGFVAITIGLGPSLIARASVTAGSKRRGKKKRPSLRCWKKPGERRSRPS